MPSKPRGKLGHTARKGGGTDAVGAGAGAGAGAGDTVGAASPFLPNWPPLSPLVPVEDLCMLALLPDQIILIRKLFTASLCKSLVTFLSSLPLITTPAKAKEGNAVRINDRFEVQDWDFAQRLWTSTGLADIVTESLGASETSTQDPNESKPCWGGDLCGLNPRIRVYRYRKGQRFGPHCTFTNRLAHLPPFDSSFRTYQLGSHLLCKTSI